MSRVERRMYKHRRGQVLARRTLLFLSALIVVSGLIARLTGTGGITVPDEEKGRYQYCCFTDREGKASLLKSPAQPDMYTIQAEHFLACIRGEVTCESPGTQAV